MHPHKALTLTFAQNTIANLDAKTVEEAYKQFESDSDKHFEDNMRTVMKNVLDIDEYMRHVWYIVKGADEEVFYSHSPFTGQWRRLHERFRFALRQSRDLAVRLAEKIGVFYEDILPLFEAENSNISVQEKKAAFRRFANVDDATGVNRSMLEDQEACERLGREFDDIRVDIASFAGAFEVTLKKTDEEFEQRIRELQRAMHEVENEFRQSQNPFESFAAFVSGARISREHLEEKMHSLDRVLGDTSRLHHNIEHLIQTGMPIIHLEVGRVGTKMKVLAEIWAYLRSQAQEARLKMEQSTSDELPEFLRPDMVKQTKIGYLKLYICVEQYAAHMEPIFARDF